MPSLQIRDEVQEVLDHFAALLGIRIAFFPPAGGESRVGLAQGCQPFCARLRQMHGRQAMCEAEDRRRVAEAAACGGLVAYRCHAGLDEAVMPLVVDGATLGYVMIGQWRSCRRPPAGCSWSTLRDPALRRAFARVPFHPPARRAHILGIFRLLVAHIVARRLVAPRDAGAVGRALGELARGRRLGQAAAARLAGVAPSTLSHRFRRELGTSFTRARIDGALERADALLAQGLPVGEVARRCGWQDPAWFSRLYRRHRGRPPSAMRPRL